MVRTIYSILFLIFFSMLLMVEYAISNAGQDTDQQTSTVTLVIAPACNLGIVDNNVSQTITVGSTADQAFIQGFIEFDASKPTLIVNSNKDWKLSVNSTDFTGPYSKNISDLQLKDLSASHVANGFDSYQPLSTSGQDVAMYNTGVKNESHPIQYRILLDWEKDIPGTYEATVVYTLSTIGS